MILYSIAHCEQLERRHASERVAAGFLSRARRGLWNGGILPLACEPDSDQRGSLRVVEDEAKVVRTAFPALHAVRRNFNIGLNKAGSEIKMSSMSEADDFDFSIYPPLKDCFEACEIVCVRGCCGLDAFSSDREGISAWTAQVNRETIQLALQQLLSLIDEVHSVRNPFYNIIPSFFESYTVSPEDQKSFKDFLAQIHSALLEDLKGKSS